MLDFVKLMSLTSEVPIPCYPMDKHYASSTNGKCSESEMHAEQTKENGG